ncbi:MAG: hypothetical protein IJY26_03850 [Clostridia bacterium]|nr:hypothetical protein [Clostridia bacterium]
MFFSAKDIALVAVTVALLIGGQLALSMASGVEIVTILLLCFSYCFGAKRGMLAATAFSLLRCFIWGFYPTVIVLYLIYYNLFAFLFGLMGARQSEEAENKFNFVKIIFTELLFLLIFATCVFIITEQIQISFLLLDGLKTLSWLILSVNGFGFVTYNALLFLTKKFPAFKRIQRVLFIAAVASVCTICFTLLDDIITPLFYGYTYAAALAYFDASFAAMIPQTLCTIVTVALLFHPLTKIFNRVVKSIAK